VRLVFFLGFLHYCKARVDAKRQADPRGGFFYLRKLLFCQLDPDLLVIFHFITSVAFECNLGVDPVRVNGYLWAIASLRVTEQLPVLASERPTASQAQRDAPPAVETKDTHAAGDLQTGDENVE
jgi:hypothetical protein